MWKILIIPLSFQLWPRLLPHQTLCLSIISHKLKVSTQTRCLFRGQVSNISGCSQCPLESHGFQSACDLDVLRHCSETSLFLGQKQSLLVLPIFRILGLTTPKKTSAPRATVRPKPSPPAGEVKIEKPWDGGCEHQNPNMMTISLRETSSVANKLVTTVRGKNGKGVKMTMRLEIAKATTTKPPGWVITCSKATEGCDTPFRSLEPESRSKWKMSSSQLVRQHGMNEQTVHTLSGSFSTIFDFSPLEWIPWCPIYNSWPSTAVLWWLLINYS